jgi:UMF1 family MFS transporter
MFVVAFLSPILGAIADYAGSRNRFLFLYTAICCVFTAALFTVTENAIVVGMVLFILAEIGYRSAQVFYNSLLPGIASEEETGRVSGNGWAIGSAGGVVCLVIVLAMIMVIGGDDPARKLLMTRLSFIVTAIYFAIFALPLFTQLRERPAQGALPRGKLLLRLPFQRIAETFRAVRTYKEFGRFLLAFLIYNDGILMMLGFAAILGTVLFGMGTEQMIVFMILVQLASIPGAFVMGWITDRLGARSALLLSLAGMLISAIWLYLATSVVAFYLIGVLAGFSLTGAQSVSRAMVSLLAPTGRSAEFYGFFAVAGRTSSSIGPFVFGFIAYRVTQWLQNRTGEELTQQALDIAAQQGHRIAVLAIAVFLLVGALLLLFVNEKAGRQLANSANQ